ncbi:MAG: Probable membrane transporter protein [uncultured Thiotrichaceae bacterium]|uniref:Probable membrane transporter protein n=1 Tax=uncultured Thiotrichaceae bacterium TaxID=298394 RepID=A0A6S6SMV5_9GAMM|nr:MAG: Probable membrane transporter protein [uncultured Thiotrichaceae bacterium]
MSEVLLMPLWALAVTFFVVAFAYSSVGLGGGSSYTALMAIVGLSVVSIPTLTLTLNLFVTAIGSYHFIKNRHASFALILPFLISSMPMAYVGGSLQLGKELFQYVLLASLLIVAAKIYIWGELTTRFYPTDTQKVLISIVLGSILGLIAGIVGIGGGVYLIPLILIFNLGSAKEAAACASIFIFLTSLAGLFARLQNHEVDVLAYWPLALAVVLGGFVGSKLGATTLNPKVMEKVLGLIILLAIFLLSMKLIT